MEIGTLLSPALRALVADRAYPEQAPSESDYPYIVFRQGDLQPLSTLSGDGPTDVLETYSIDVWHDSRQEANAVGLQVRAALLAMNASGEMINAFQGLAWDFDPETGLHACTQQFLIPNEI